MDTNRRQLIRGAAAGAAAIGAPGLLLAQNQPIRIGMLNSLSGAYAGAGLAYDRGFRVAIHQANQAGGVLGRQIEGIPRDDKFSGAGAIAAVRDLSGMGVNLVMSGGGSVSTLAVAPLLKELNMVFVNGGAAAMSIRHEAYVRNMFSTVANVYVQFGGIGRAMAEQFPNVTKWAIIVPDNTFGRESYKLVSGMLRKFHAKAASLTIRDPILVNQAQGDFRAQINTLMNSDVEGVYMGAVGGATVSFIQQARAVGLDKKLKVIAEGSGDLTAKALGRDMPAAFWGPVFWPPYQVERYKSNKAVQQLYKDLVEVTKEQHPTSISNLGYRAAQGLLAGIKKAGTTETEAVIKAMEGMTFDTPNGPYRFRERDHQAVGTTLVAKFVASSKEPYYDITEAKGVSDESVIETPSPGAEYVI